MKRKESSVRSRKFTIRLTPEEFEKLEQKARATTSRDISEYIRKHLANDPVTIRYRSKSLDEFIPIAIGLKNELNAAGKNFNQAVKKLQSLHDSGELKQSLEFFETTQFTLYQKIEEIKSILIKSYQLWSQK